MRFEYFPKWKTKLIDIKADQHVPEYKKQKRKARDIQFVTIYEGFQIGYPEIVLKDKRILTLHQIIEETRQSEKWRI